jgi:signal peptidase
MKKELFKIISNSMYPILKKGDVAIVERIGFEEIKIGDIIAFKIEDKIFIHRVVIIRNNIITTKGDNNLYNDNVKISFANYIGKYVDKITI